MYLGFNLLTISAMVNIPNIIIIAMGIYCIVVYHLIILKEELFLTKRFGSDYIEYKQKVRRYF